MTATLLLADDSVTIQRVIELTFAGEDVRVVAVGDGDAAIAKLEEAAPDIVLADIGMPGKSGYEISSYIKQSPRFAHIPVLLLVGAFEPVDQRKLHLAGCDGVLAKPFEPQLVIARVRELLARPRSDPEATRSIAPEPIPVASTPELDRPAPAVGGAATARAAVDDFFDQLDAAFAKLPEDRVAADLPLSFTSPQSDFDRVPAAAIADMRVAGDAAPVTAQNPSPTNSGQTRAATDALPGLAEAFAALLAAEQRGEVPGESPAWSPAAPVLTEELVERVAERVLERLSDQVVRETIADLVSTIAERLVREEIQRIKDAIK